MKYFKQISIILAIALLIPSLGFFIQSGRALASVTPTLQLVGNGDGDTVQVTVNGDPNVSVLLFYPKTNVGSQATSIGTTNSSGVFSTNISSSGYGIASGSSVYVRTNGISGPQSNIVSWPNVTTTGNFSLTPTAVVLAVGQSANISVANNGSNSVYLSNNSNPPVANASISGSQITITALAYGSTSFTFCLSASTTTCASAYVTVSNTSVQALTFSISNVTVAPSQSVPIVITGGTGVYQVLNNSNSSVIQTSISTNTITLTTSATSGSSAITVCSSDMSSCGIINATAGSASTSAVVFGQTNPTLSIGQSLSISLAGGSSTSYYVSSNSSSAIVQPTVSGSYLTLVGLSSGTATLTVCSTSGSCGTLTVTVGYTSAGGALHLSQTNLSVLVGQVLSVTISGGITPYNLYPSSQSNIFQASLSNNIITVSGLSAGSANLNVCSSDSTCTILSVTVNASGAGTPITFSQNNLNLNIGATEAFTISGSGGYYVSNSSVQNVASVQITGSAGVVTGLGAGTSNISICQSGGQCAILFVTVGSTGTTNQSPIFSQVNPSLSVGQSLSVTVSGGTSSSYYISSNSNPASAQLTLTNNVLSITGISNGSTTAVICANSTSCSPLTVTVGSTVIGGSLALNPATLSVTAGQIGNVSISGGGNYYVFNSTNPTVATAQISGSTASVTGLAAGSDNIFICQSGGQCAVLPVTVNSSVAAVTPPAPVSGAHPAGTNVLSPDGTVSMITSSGTRRPYTSAGAFLSYGFNSWANVATANSGDLTLPVGTFIPPRDGKIICSNNGSDEGTCYLITDGEKAAFTSSDIFTALGFSFANALSGDVSFLSSANNINSSTQAHPAGVLVNKGGTIYLVGNSGLLGVPNMTSLTSWGYSLSDAVTANTADASLSQTGVMPAYVAGDLSPFGN